MKEVKSAAASPEVRAALHEVMAVFEAYKAANDARLDAVEQKRADGLHDDKLERIEQSLQAAEQRLNRLVSQKARPALDNAAPVDEAKAAWDGYMRSGRAGLELKAGISSASGSGVLAPTETEAFVARRLQAISPMRSLASMPLGLWRNLRLPPHEYPVGQHLLDDPAVLVQPHPRLHLRVVLQCDPVYVERWRTRRPRRRKEVVVLHRGRSLHTFRLPLETPPDRSCPAPC